MIETLKKNPRTIVFTEGTDNRILDAADKLTAEGILGVILLGTEEEVKAAAKAGNYNIEKCSIIDPAGYPEMDAMVAEMVKLRKGKMTEEQCRKALSQSNYFGTMLVKMGKADCLLGGATYSTADTVRPALQLIKTKPGNKIVSSCFILVRGDERSPWETVRLTLILLKMIWLKSQSNLQRPQRSSVLTLKWLCCLTPHWVPARDLL